ncbi:MAG: guanylate kinase [Actinomycetota bacterium]
MPLFVISGPSGAGKGTLVRGVLERLPQYRLSISATTRPMRPGERQGIDYRFMSEQEFSAMRDRGEFLETAEVYGNHYGTPRAPIERSLASGHPVIAELDIQGAQAVKRAKPDAVLIFVEAPSLDDLFRRLRGRGTEDDENLSRRLRAAYEEVRSKGVYDHIVVNDHVERATDELVRILEEESTTRRRRS